MRPYSIAGPQITDRYSFAFEVNEKRVPIMYRMGLWLAVSDVCEQTDLDEFAIRSLRIIVLLPKGYTERFV